MITSHPELDSGSTGFRVKPGMTKWVKPGMTKWVKPGMAKWLKLGMK